MHRKVAENILAENVYMHSAFYTHLTHSQRKNNGNKEEEEKNRQQQQNEKPIYA